VNTTVARRIPFFDSLHESDDEEIVNKVSALLLLSNAVRSGTRSGSPRSSAA
jgi:hypothetical protein